MSLPAVAQRDLQESQPAIPPDSVHLHAPPHSLSLKYGREVWSQGKVGVWGMEEGSGSEDWCIATQR